jgi:hypothetical protein
MMRLRILPGVLFGAVAIMSLQGPAWPNGTHKRKSTTDLDATVTCTKKNKTTVKLEVLADALRRFLVRADSGEAIVAQEVTSVAISAVDKAHKTVKAVLDYANGGSAPEKLKASSATGTDDENQDRQIALAECKSLTIAPHKPSQSLSTDDEGLGSGRVFDSKERSPSKK